MWCLKKIVADLEDKSIMISAKNNKILMDLQYKIRTALKDYSNYRKPILEQYETVFKPHITIAMDLGDRFDEAIKDIGGDTKCIGEITEIILSCVKEDTAKEAKNPKNLTIYKL
jgi:2'-5' RNA ligase